MPERISASFIVRLNLTEHLAALLLASTAIMLLLYNQATLSTRGGVSLNIPAAVLLQEGLIIVFIACVIVASIPATGWRWEYTLASFLFIGYAGLQMAGTFISTLDLAPILQAQGVPVQDYLSTSYLLTLASAVAYILSILVLRRSYGKLLRLRSATESAEGEKP